MSGTILHRRPYIAFDPNGIKIRFMLFGETSLSWSEIKYISPTPEYQQTNGSWIPRGGRNVPGQPSMQWLGNGRDLELKLVTNASVVPTWMLFSLGSVFAKPLYGADDRPLPSSRVIFLQLNIARLSAPISALFDLLSTHCQFDLVVTD